MVWFGSTNDESSMMFDFIYDESSIASILQDPFSIIHHLVKFFRDRKHGCFFEAPKKGSDFRKGNGTRAISGKSRLVKYYNNNRILKGGVVIS